MDSFDVIQAIFAGVCLYAAATHLLIGLNSNPRNWLHLSFSLVSLFFGIYSVNIFLLYSAFDTGSLSFYIFTDRWGIATYYLAFAALFWFIALYVGARRGSVLWLIIGMYTLISGLCFVLPYPWVYTDITLTTAFPPDIVVAPWYSVEQVITILLLTFYSGYYLLKQYRRGEKKRAGVFGIALGVFLVTVLWDYGIEYGLIDSVLMQQYGFVVFIALMSLQLSGRVVAAEKETERLNIELEKHVKTRTAELGERVKELNCLYGISAVVEQPGITLNEILQTAAALLPPAWQYNEVACARIWLNDHQYTSESFQETDWKQTSHILVHGEIRGGVEVYYLEEMPTAEEGSFLQAERKLINAVAERLGRIVERFQAQENIHRRISELSILNQVAQIIAVAADPLNCLGEIAKVIADLFSSRIVIFTIPGDEETELQTLVGYELDQGIFTTSNKIFTLGEMPFTRNLLHTGESAYLSDLSNLAIPSNVRVELETLNLSKLLLIPLKALGDVLGLLVLGFDDPQTEIGQPEIALAETIAGDVAAAIKNARLAELARSAAVNAERQRLARDLHDSATQSIYSLTLLSSGWESMARQGTLEDPADSFRQLGEVGYQALREMRLLIHQLRSDVLEEVGLLEALQQRLDSVERRTNIEPVLIAEGNLDDLPPEIEDQLFNIAQEALNNSLRHAQATEVIVEINEHQGQVELTISDNGKGYDTERPVTGMGLENMTERARSIGAEIKIASETGQGTTVSIIAPTRFMKEETE